MSQPKKTSAKRKPSRASAVNTNAAALEETLRALASAGRLRELDSARVQALRSIARALDVKPHNSQMWKEYRTALAELAEDREHDGSIARLLAGFTAPAVRDAKKA